LQRLLEGDETANSVNDNVTKDGETIRCSWTNTPLKREDGSIIGVLSMVQDITERQKAEKALRESEARFRSLYENSFDAVLLTKPDGTILSANSAACSMFGMTEEEITEAGRNGLVIMDDRLISALEERKRLGKARAELTFKRRDGSTFEGETTSSIFTDIDGTVKTSMIIRDITERKNAEHGLQASEKKYRELANQLPVIMYEIDREGRFTFINEKGYEVNGYSREDYEKGLNILQLVSDDDKGKAKARIQRILSGEKIDYSEYTVLRKDGSTFPAIACVSAIINEGKITGFRGIVIDISERKKSEELLRESEERFRDLYESIQEPVAVYVGREGCLINYNSAFKKLFGYTDEELKDKTFLDLSHPDDRAMVLEKYRTEYPQEKLPLVYEVRGINKKGETEYFEVSVNSYRRKGRVIGIEVIYRDISERKRMEEKLRESEERLRDLYESILDPLAVYVGKEGRILDCNKAFRGGWLGYTDEELKGITFLDAVHPDCHAMLIEEYRKEYSEKDFPRIYEIKCVNKKGEIRPFEISVGPFRKKGKVIGINVMHRDITERKRMEQKLRDSEEGFRNLSEKLRVVGGLTRHDVNNKLSIITANAYLLKRQLPDNKEALDKIKDMESSVSQITRMFDFARDYERLGIEESSLIDVETMVQKAANLFSSLKGVKIVNECRGLAVMADSLLQRAFYNLIDNSLKYGEKLTQIRIRYEKSEKQLKLIYEDDGVGISQDDKARLFAEGFSTGRGSGYGLYLIKKTMEFYGWTISETGTHGKGAQFTINIPEAKPDGRQNYKLS
jgi:PAS domain S-box-containing protein